MTHDVIIRNGTLIDGTGAPGKRADLAIDGDRITAIGTHRRHRAGRDRRGRQARHAGLRRHPHAPRCAARVGSERVVVVLSRHHVGGARQLRRHVRAVQAAGPRLPREDDGVGRRHSGGEHPLRFGVGLGNVRRIPRVDVAPENRRERRRHGRPLRGALSRDGRARPRRRAGERGRHRAHVRSRRRSDRRRCARLLDVAHVHAPRAGRPSGAWHLRARRRTARDRPRARQTQTRRVRSRRAARRARQRCARQHPPRSGTVGRDQPRERRGGYVRPHRERAPAGTVPARHRSVRTRKRARREPASADDVARHRRAVRCSPPHAVRSFPRVAGTARQIARRDGSTC